VEALLTDNGWLEYRLQMVRDELLSQGTQAASDASVVEKVMSALLERDEALRKAHEDLAAMRTWRRSGRQSSPRLDPSSNRTVRPSRERGLGRARLRRWPRRPTS
jgi:hypothetical protein